MSSLLALQTKGQIIFASDTALSVQYNDNSYRVGNHETKLFEFENFIMFASGKKYLRDLLLNKLTYKSSLYDIENYLTKTILPLSEEFSLEVVIALKDLSRLIFFSSTDGFKYRENICDDNTHLFTAGYKTNDISDHFIKEFSNNDIRKSLINTYKHHSCEEIGGNLDVIFITKGKIQKEKYLIDNKKEYSSTELGELLNLVHAERLVGKVLLGNKLHIESDSGITQINGDTTSVYDKNRNLKIEMGQYTHNNVTKYGLKVHDGAIDIVNGLPKSQINQSAVQAWDSAEGNAKGHANSLNTSIRSDLRLSSPLPTSLTLDNSGITAYTASSSNYARLDYRGLYIQGGAMDIRTSSSSNRGIVLDGNGLRGYNSSGTKTFEIDTYGNGMFAGYLEYAKGNLDNVAGTFAGTVTGDLSANTVRAIRITADQITALKIRAEMMEVTNLSAISANLGNITSGNIRISEDLHIGSGLYLGTNKSDLYRGVYFGNTQIIQDNTGWLNLGNRVSIGAFSKFNGSVDMSGVNLNLSGANVTGLNLTARFG